MRVPGLGDRTALDPIAARMFARHKLFSICGDPRTAAGASNANDVLKYSLKPLRASGHKQTLTAEQLTRLNKTFPNGACDYTRPAIGQQFVADTWQIY